MHEGAVEARRNDDDRRRRIAAKVPAAVAALSLAVLTGWWLDIAWLTTLLPRMPATQPITAINMLLSAAALFLLAVGGRRETRVAAAAIVVLVGAMASTTLAAYAGLVDELIFDHLILPSQIEGQPFSYLKPGRMAVATSVMFELMVVGLGGLIGGGRKAHRLAVIVASLGIVLAGITLLGHVVGSAELRGMGFHSHVGLPTALGQSALFLSIILLAPKQAFPRFAQVAAAAFGLFEQASRRHDLPFIARYGLSLAVVALVALTVLAPQDNLEHYYYLHAFVPATLLVAVTLGTGPGVTAVLAATLLLRYFVVEPRYSLNVAAVDDFLLLLTFLAAHMAVVAVVAALQYAREKLAAVERHQRLIFQDAPLPVMVHDQRGRVMALNRAWSDATGYAEGEFRSVAEWGRLVHVSSDAIGYGEIELDTLDGDRRVWVTKTANLGLDHRGRNTLVTMALDVTDRKRIEAAMAAVAKSAEDTMRAKSQFLAAANHDLRQPFQAMRLFLDVLRSQLNDAHQRLTADRLDEAMAAGEELLSAILDVATLDAGTTRVNLAEVAVDAVLAPVVAKFAPRAAEKGLKLRYLPCGSRMITDSVLLQRMIGNIIDNAIKYTRRGGVVVGCRRNAQSLRLEVWDSGIGIEERHLSRIFDEFFQVDNSARDRRLGLGLGLAVVAKAAAILGYEVSARSRIGHGSVFTISLPRSPQDKLAVNVTDQELL